MFFEVFFAVIAAVIVLFFFGFGLILVMNAPSVELGAAGWMLMFIAVGLAGLAYFFGAIAFGVGLIGIMVLMWIVTPGD